MGGRQLIGDFPDTEHANILTQGPGTAAKQFSGVPAAFINGSAALPQMRIRSQAK
jgi:hypothetical protein